MKSFYSESKAVNYLKLVKFSHTIFAMPFAVTGFFLARHQGYEYKWITLGFIVLCMVFARNAAMAFNRYADREVDLRNPRTALREIPAGIIRPDSALKFVIFNCLAFIATTFFINRLTLFLSPVALLVILGYSITKRFTSLCHFVLGLGLSLSPIGAFLSVSGQFEWLPIMFSLIVLFWVSGFDIMYALQDEEFDKQHSLRSVPTSLGASGALWFSAISHGICLAVVVFTGIHWGFRFWYWIGASLFGALLVYQHLLVKPHDLSQMNKAFFTSNSLAGLVLAFFSILSMLC
jgi:4-hydroxybenzoate polyprenyltransferase